MTQSALDNESPDTPAPGHSGQDPARRIRVSYQGTDGAFSHQAAMQHFSRYCAEVELASLRRVLSHPQAIAQCSRFLAGLPDCHVETYFDTAMAAQKVRDDADLTQAATPATTRPRSTDSASSAPASPTRWRTSPASWWLARRPEGVICTEGGGPKSGCGSFPGPG